MLLIGAQQHLRLEDLVLKLRRKMQRKCYQKKKKKNNKESVPHFSNVSFGSNNQSNNTTWQELAFTGYFASLTLRIKNVPGWEFKIN